MRPSSRPSPNRLFSCARTVLLAVMLSLLNQSTNVLQLRRPSTVNNLIVFVFPFDDKIIRKMANDLPDACCDVCFTFNVDSKDFCSCVQLLRKKIITPIQSPQVCLGPATRSSMHACVTLIVWPKCPWKVFMMALNEQPLFHFITSKVSTVTNLGRCSTSWASVSKSLWRCAQIWSLKKGKSTGFPLNHVSCIPLSIWAFHIAATGSHGVWSPQVPSVIVGH